MRERLPARPTTRAGPRGRPDHGPRGLDLVPVVDDDGELAGVDDRARARPPLHPRVARGVDASTRRRRVERDRRGARAASSSAATDARADRPRVGAGDGHRLAPARLGAGDVVVVGDRADAQRLAIEVGVALLVIAQRHRARRRDPRARARARDGRGASPLDSYVTGRMITLVGAVPRADGHRAADRARPTICSPTSPSVKDVDYRAAVAVDGARPPDRARHPRRPRQPDAAAGAARRPRRAGAERRRHRAGRDRRDPRPPPHRLDRDARPGAGDVRPRRLDRDARDRALPPERHGAQPRRRRRCCSARSCPTR